MMSLRDARNILRRAKKRYNKAVDTEIDLWKSGVPNLPIEVTDATDALDLKEHKALALYEEVLARTLRAQKA
jgi:hypothetical protein